MAFHSLHPLRTAFAVAAFLSSPGLIAAQASQTPLVGDGVHAVTGMDLMAETSTLDDTTRSRMLSSPESVQRMATDMYVRRSLAAQAQAQKLDEDPQVRQLLHIVRERVLADALSKRMQAQSRPTGPVLENLARQNYKVQMQRFRQPERIHTRHILIPLDAPDAQQLAEDLRRQIVAGANFEVLAKEHSKDPGSAAKGGDLGLLPRGRMIKPFEEAAFALSKPGDVSEVVKTEFGYHIIQLVERRDAGIQPFEEVKDQLMEEAARGIGAGAREELVNPILEKAQVHPDAIEAFSAAYRK